jgi:hypothetical protein
VKRQTSYYYNIPTFDTFLHPLYNICTNPLYLAA